MLAIEAALIVDAIVDGAPYTIRDVSENIAHELSERFPDIDWSFLFERALKSKV